MSESTDIEISLINNEENNNIEIQIGLDSFSVLIFLYPIIAVLICLILFIMEGRFAGYLPTVSETGTESPNAQVFSHANGMSSITTFYTQFLLIIFIKIYQENNEFLIFLLKILMLNTFIGVFGVGMSPLNELKYHHYIFALLGFLSMIIFQFLTYLIIKNQNLIRIRSILICLEFISIILFSFSNHISNNRYCITISTIGEYILLLSIQTYLLTFKSELKSLKMTLSIIE